MDKLIETLSRIPQDKLLHSFYGVLVYSVVAILDVGLAMWAVVVVALTKEVWDEYKYSRFDWIDIVATVALPLALFISEGLM